MKNHVLLPLKNIKIVCNEELIMDKIKICDDEILLMISYFNGEIHSEFDQYTSNFITKQTVEDYRKTHSANDILTYLELIYNGSYDEEYQSDVGIEEGFYLIPDDKAMELIDAFESCNNSNFNTYTDTFITSYKDADEYAKAHYSDHYAFIQRIREDYYKD